MIRYDAVDKYLASRLTMPTALSSRGIGETIPPAIRAQAFFSAEVEAARTLAELREFVTAYSRGEINRAEARTRLKEYLGGGNDGSDLKDLGSSRRLNLILDQNSRMAQAVGQYQVSHDPAILERWPYYRYITGPNPRPEHAALDNLVLPKDDPFWQTHTPPWDFNCNCQLEDCDAAEAESLGGVAARAPEIPAAESGFRFDPADAFGVCDLGRVPEVRDRAEVIDRITELAKREKIDFVGVIMPDERAAPLASGPSAVDIRLWVGEQLDASANRRPTPEKALPLGTLSEALTGELGLAEAPRVELTRGRTISHMEKNRHGNELADGTFAEALADTLYSDRVDATLSIASGRPRMINLASRSSSAMCTLEESGDKWRVLSAHRWPVTDDTEYYRRKWHRTGPR